MFTYVPFHLPENKEIKDKTQIIFIAKNSGFL